MNQPDVWEERSAQVGKVGRNNCVVTWAAIFPSFQASILRPARSYSSPFCKSTTYYLWDALYQFIFAFNNKSATFNMQCCLGLREPLTLWKCFCAAKIIHLQWLVLIVCNQRKLMSSCAERGQQRSGRAGCITIFAALSA